MRLLPAALVFGAAGAGYIYTNEEFAKTLSPAAWISDEQATTSPGTPESIEKLANAPAEEIVAVAGPAELRLDEIFRFDLTPRAIADRWNRVSTGLGDVRYQGYRVPLVTGTTSRDLAGSLTYYFDSSVKLRRITFLGTTGAPEPVIEFLSRQYGFDRHDTGNARVTTYRTRYRYTGLLEITPAGVLDRDQARKNYQIDLSIER
ncbi:MAG: hypothetical protein EXS05_11680 [Planctomycetaceae bacterium]|nr:hypothetical protein [Planctomycetaceae bacterium]